MKLTVYVRWTAGLVSALSVRTNRERRWFERGSPGSSIPGNGREAGRREPFRRVEPCSMRTVEDSATPRAAKRCLLILRDGGIEAFSPGRAAAWREVFAAPNDRRRLPYEMARNVDSAQVVERTAGPVSGLAGSRDDLDVRPGRSLGGGRPRLLRLSAAGGVNERGDPGGCAMLPFSPR